MGYANLARLLPASLRSPAFNLRLEAAFEPIIQAAEARRLSVTLDIGITGDIPAWQERVVLLLATDLVRSAVDQGMDLHLIGKVSVTVETALGGTVLEVVDDGWARERRRYDRVMSMVMREAGTLEVEIDWAQTAVRIFLPG